MTLEEICDYFKKAEEEMIRKAGGVNKWQKLSDIKKVERKAKMIEEAVAELCKGNWKLDLAKLAGGPKINIL